MTKKHLASFALIALIFAACDNTETPKTDLAAKTESPSKQVTDGALKFAYVNTDSLSFSFDMIKDLEEEIVQERLQMENQLQAMVKDLENDYTAAQRESAGLSQEALSILQQKLSQKEQGIMQQRDGMESQLMRSEQLKTSAYLEKVQSFLDEYAKSEGYDMIYGYNGLNNLLYIDKSYDITGIVVDSLNAKYQSQKLTADK
ncbi:OmpH family outer membrane protein [Salibacteraceae bacterium]|nr:OmpH family outer membrane protein [Salibacteraceae bacterium]MDA9267492.1 OmpH family outer membrane protein [Salibacteraceae bacterium]MDB4105762.1 OmpH family outer membrane protein [Salibacteraceae bacterium]MDB9710243.1 OmpH family outer membrane protein [Salibacteraceae bacterium]